VSDQTFFQVQRGAVVSDCMEETYDFINQNLEFFYQNLKPVREALGADDYFVFVSHEDRWSFSCRVDRVELGRVAQGVGIISEGSNCPYDTVTEELSNSPLTSEA